MKILLVEDDSMIAYGLMYALEQEGYEAQHCTNVRDALCMIGQNAYDLAILDMQLPDGTGMEISERIKGSNTKIIFLTVVDDESTIVKTFEEGVADYVTKPFRLREFLARVKRTLNDKKDSIDAKILKMGEVDIDTASGKVYVDGHLVELTALEYRLLLVFAINKGKLLTRAQILDGIWDKNGNFVEDNTLTVYVKRLREKLGGSITIETVRGVGYRVG